MAEQSEDFNRKDGSQKRARFVTGQQPARPGGATGKKGDRLAASARSASHLARLKRHHPEQYERLMREAEKRGADPPEK